MSICFTRRQSRSRFGPWLEVPDQSAHTGSVNGPTEPGSASRTLSYELRPTRHTLIAWFVSWKVHLLVRSSSLSSVLGVLIPCFQPSHCSFFDGPTMRSVGEEKRPGHCTASRQQDQEDLDLWNTPFSHGRGGGIPIVDVPKISNEKAVNGPKN